MSVKKKTAIQTAPKMGRPSKFTPQRVQQLLKAISDGLPYKAACNLTGICFDTFNEWKKENSEFLDQVKKAEAEAIVRRLKTIEQAAEMGSWQASAWLLERRHPDMFGKPEVQISQNVHLSENKQNFVIDAEYLNKLQESLRELKSRT